DVLIRISRQVSGLAQLAFTRNALVRLGRMFDPVLKLAAGSWRSFRHHVRSARCIDRSTGSGMKFHVVTDRKLVGHCLDPDCRLVTATLGSRTVAATKPANLTAYSLSVSGSICWCCWTTGAEPSVSSAKYSAASARNASAVAGSSHSLCHPQI